MTRRVECEPVTVTHDCGYIKTARTQGLADHGLRKHSCERHRFLADRKRRGDAIRAAHAASRTDRKPCLHKQAKHVHGTHACYVLDSCRCTDCTQANRTYETRRVRDLAYGRVRLIDATPAREHVRALMAQGMGWKPVARAAGISSGAMTKLLYGVKSTGRPPAKRIRPDAAERILSVTLDLQGGAKVDATETRRLVQAIVARGYSLAWICRRVGLTNQRLLYRETVVVSTARAIAALADECAVKPGTCSRAFNLADRNGWTADVLWGDAAPDDEPSGPDIDPVKVQRVVAGEREQLTHDERYAVYCTLRAAGTVPTVIGDRLRMSSTSLRLLTERYDAGERSEVAA